jgi:hypothetical protein
VTILSSVTPIISNKKYTLNSGPLDISFDSFEVVPNNYDVGPNSINAYLFTGQTLPKLIDPSSYLLTKVSDLDWVIFYQASKTLTINSQDLNYVGDH